jgi:16S rRNA (guanine966-N2)-methyltransferase
MPDTFPVMRVIAGRHRGRRLRAPAGSSTRPVTDRAKESIFSSIAARIPAARVLDLYAGAGSFGIEALSRGAASAVFVESGREALAVLRSNLADLDLLEVATVVARRVEAALDDLAGPFDVVFCDPPWPVASADLEAVLARVVPVLAPDGLVVVTRRVSDPVPRPRGIGIADDRPLGDTRIIRYAIMSDG